MTIRTGALNNPDPANWKNITYTVQSGDCLWAIAKKIAAEEAKANGQSLSGDNLTAATANELALIEQANPQIVGSNGSGTYDLIYAGDKIAIPVQTPASGTSVPAATAKKGAAGFDVPGVPGSDNTSRMSPGQDILSADGKYDLVLLGNGDLVLYQLATPWQRTDNYRGDTEVWQSGTVGQPVDHADHVSDPSGKTGGTMVLYSADGTVIPSASESAALADFLKAIYT